MKVYLDDRLSQQGAVIVIALLMLTVLSLSSMMAAKMAVNDGTIMRNSRKYLCDLYRAETGITGAEETHVMTWLAPDSDLFDLSLEDAVMIVDDFSIKDSDGNDMPVMGRYAIARIENAPVTGTLSGKFYTLGHQAPMPVGSGFSAMNFEIRRYGILSTGSSRQARSGTGVTIEAGLYKVFNRF